MIVGVYRGLGFRDSGIRGLGLDRGLGGFGEFSEFRVYRVSGLGSKGIRPRDQNHA